MNKYYIINQRENVVDISNDEVFKEYLISKEDIVEHLRAQLIFMKEHKDYRIKPILIGVTTEKFTELVSHLSSKYKGFLYSYFVNRNQIPILLQPKGGVMIVILDSEKMAKNND